MENTTVHSYVNPFPGLRPFTLDESHLFFGREGQSEEVLRNLSANRFVGVIGASGSGKSSLIYCGLIPILHGGFITQAGSKWQIMTMRPGNGPIHNLAHSLVSNQLTEGTNEDDLHSEVALTASMLRGSSLGLIESIKKANYKSDENILILVDQFEELFRYKRNEMLTDSENESEAFIKLLVEAVNQSEVPIYVVLTMRSDFIGDCSQFQDLTKMINKSHYLIPQMTRDDFRKAVEGPVAVGGAAISPQLVQQLLNDVGDNPDQLPILQHSLMRTWDYWTENHEQGEPLSLQHYEAVGTMKRALSEHADEAYAELNDKGKEICEAIFKTLTEKGGDNRGIRHPASVAEMTAISGATSEEIISVVDVFRKQGRSFLTPADHINMDESSVVDISHESLMRIWTRLSNWVDAEAGAVQMYLRLSEAAEMYQEGKTGLWRPPDLQLAMQWKDKQQPTLAWAQRYAPAFERTMVFLATSQAEFEAEEENKIKIQRRRLRRSRLVALILGIAAIISIGVGLWAFTQQQRAEEQSRIAQEKKAEAERNALEADRQKQSAKKSAIKAEQAKETALQEKERAEVEKERAEAQKKIADKNANLARQQTSIARRKSKEANEQRSKAEQNAKEANKQRKKAEDASKNALNLRMLSIAKSMAVKSQQFRRSKNKDIKSLMAYQAYQFNDEFGGDPKDADVYAGLYSSLKLIKGDDFNRLKGHSSSVKSIRYNPSTKKMFSTGSDGKVIMWDMANNKAKTNLNEGGPMNNSLSVSSDGKYVACGKDNSKIEVYTIGSTEVKTLDKHVGKVLDVEFVPGKNKLVSAGADSTVLLWDIGSGNNVVVAKSKHRVNSVSTSMDGKWIAGGTANGDVILWDITAGNASQILPKGNQESSGVYTVQFSSNGKYLAAGDLDGTIHIWDISKGTLVYNLGGHNARVHDIAFSPKDDMMATASFDGTVQLWQMSNLNAQPIVLNDHGSWVWTVSFTDDGNTLITGCVGSEIKEWPTSANNMASQICYNVSRNMTGEEWKRYVAKDIPFKKTCPDK